MFFLFWYRIIGEFSYSYTDSRKELKGEGEYETHAVCDAYRHANKALFRKILHHAAKPTRQWIALLEEKL